MKSQDIIIIGIAGITVLALLSRKSTAIPQPVYPESCDDFDSNGGI